MKQALNLVKEVLIRNLQSKSLFSLPQLLIMEDVALDNENSLSALVRAIRLSQGQFRLILVRCNYGALRDRMIQRLRKLSPVPIREIVLPQSVKSLHTTIKAELGDEVPLALMVFGLESAKELKTVLKSSNYIREEFSKDFPFPLVLWVNDEVFKTLRRIAPDLESWATSVEFKLTTDELLDFLRQRTDELFVGDAIPKLENGFELEAACHDLQSRGQELEADLEASLEFVRGLEDFARDKIDEAIEHYQKSLAFWQQNKHLERQGILVLNIALCYNRKAEQNRAEDRRYWEQSKDYFQQGLDNFEQAQRPDLVAQHINQLGEVLRNLQAWDELKTLAEKAVTLHQQRRGTANQQRKGTALPCPYPVPQIIENRHKLRLLAQDYGFLAEVALAESDGKKAHQLAQQALETLDQSSDVQPYERDLYRYLIARSQVQLGQVLKAISNLEQARQESNPQFNPQLYIDILGELRELYFDQGEYLKAFEIKRERRSIEYQYGFQAFAGAAYLHPKRQIFHSVITQLGEPAIVALEISASGREQDVKRLIERISSTHHKLIVIHGQSGVGKSSILKAGLLPALKQQAIGERDALPVMVRVYTHWVRGLGRALAKALEEVRGIKISASLDAVAAISEQLRKNADRNLLTVLIFDQFEEFFFVCTDKAERRIFFEFLRDCLNIGFVKVILSLRRDYLHYLLESEQAIDLDAINNNILDKNIRYPLGNFSRDEAKAVIQRLTERSQFYLQPELIDELVRDLAGELQEVRPIELQVVGAQLQADNITTLEQYHQSGSKEKLVEKWLDAVVQDCGIENEQAARFVLYFLTDDKDTRPLKTRAELVANLEAADLASEVEKLELVLQILVGSGLVLKIPDAPNDRYQLVHDYLVSFIRQSQQAREAAQRKQDKEERQRIEIQLKLALKKRLSLEEQLNQALKKNLREARWIGAALFSITIFAGLLGVRAAIGETNAQLNALSATSEVLVASNRQFDALLKSLKAGKDVKQNIGVTVQTRMRVITALQQTVYGVRESNQLEGHTDWVSGVSWSPNGQVLASASKDSTIKLWDKNGTLLRNLLSHQGGVYSVSFSPDGKLFASASEDKTVKLWSHNGVLLHTLIGHTGNVFSVSFSPDSKLIASGSWDGTVKLWNTKGVLLKTLARHSARVLGVSFSPDGQLIVVASRDHTISLWRADGTFIKSWKAHNDVVMSVSFSPDSQMLASSSADKTVKLWRRDGSLIETLEGHSYWVLNVTFSQDGQTIASASADNTIKLWRRDGSLIETLKGHGNLVQGVSFSPDGKTLASASADYTVKLWYRNNQLLTALNGHTKAVNQASFSPNGKIIASASDDGTAKLWSTNDRVLLVSLDRHKGAVNQVSLSPDSSMVATASDDKTVKIWNVDGTWLRTLVGHQDAVTSVSFSPDGTLIASGSADRTVKLWKADGSFLKKLIGHDDEVRWVSFSPDGELIASADEDKTVKLWRRDGKLLTTLKGHKGGVNWVSFSPDSQLIASASSDGTVNLWHWDGWSRHDKPITSLKGHNGAVYSVGFSPDGKFIASASEDKTVKLWSREGNLIKIFEGHTAEVYAVSFSPDGKTLASASRDTTIKLWNLDLDNLLVRGCDWVREYLENKPEGDSDKDLCEGVGKIEGKSPALN